jgi:hypothetical protein
MITDQSYFQVADLGYAPDLGNYGEYSGAPKERSVKHFFCEKL